MSFSVTFKPVLTCMIRFRANKFSINGFHSLSTDPLSKGGKTRDFFPRLDNLSVHKLEFSTLNVACVPYPSSESFFFEGLEHRLGSSLKGHFAKIKCMQRFISLSRSKSRSYQPSEIAFLSSIALLKGKIWRKTLDRFQF